MPERSGCRSDELEVQAASDGTGDDAVDGMLSLERTKQGARFVVTSSRKAVSLEDECPYETQHNNHSPQQNMRYLLQALGCEQPKSKLMKMEP
jgi:hypothetical protein